MTSEQPVSTPEQIFLGTLVWIRARFGRPAAASDQATSESAARMARDALSGHAAAR